MKSQITWKSNYAFEANIRRHSFTLDAGTSAGGKDEGPSPKEIVLAAICGCAGMDVIGLLRKAKTTLTSLKISAEAESLPKHPRIFQAVDLHFEATGDSAGTSAFADAVRKSQEIYCSVSAMISKSCPIRYHVLINGELVHQGLANFINDDGLPKVRENAQGQ